MGSAARHSAAYCRVHRHDSRNTANSVTGHTAAKARITPGSDVTTPVTSRVTDRASSIGAAAQAERAQPPAQPPAQPAVAAQRPFDLVEHALLLVRESAEGH